MTALEAAQWFMGAGCCCVGLCLGVLMAWAARLLLSEPEGIR